jgi:hypothetical protein
MKIRRVTQNDVWIEEELDLAPKKKRGRPKKVVAPAETVAAKETKKPIDDLTLEIAEYLVKNVCSTPGCVSKFHIEDANAILTLVRRVS